MKKFKNEGNSLGIFCGLGFVTGLVAASSLLMQFSQKVNEAELQRSTERIEVALIMISIMAIAVMFISYQLGQFWASLMTLSCFVLGVGLGSYCFGSVAESANMFSYTYAGISLNTSEALRLAVNASLYASVAYLLLLWRRLINSSV